MHLWTCPLIVGGAARLVSHIAKGPNDRPKESSPPGVVPTYVAPRSLPGPRERSAADEEHRSTRFVPRGEGEARTMIPYTRATRMSPARRGMKINYMYLESRFMEESQKNR
jgi:hypothetical protein